MAEFPAKLDPTTTAQIIEALSGPDPWPVKDIAKAFGVSPSTVKRLKAGIALQIVKDKELAIMADRLATRGTSTATMKGMGPALEEAAHKALKMISDASDYNEMSAASKALDAIMRSHAAQEKVSLSAAHDGAKPAPVEHKVKGSITFHLPPSLVPQGAPTDITYVDAEPAKQLPPSTEDAP